MRIVILEDELPAREQLEKLLRSQIENIQLMESFAKVGEAEAYLIQYPTDILFLDLDLGRSSGFEILDRMSKQSFHTVIVSGHIEKAIEAFEYGVVDFIAKPATEKTLQRALDRIRKLESNSIRMIGVKSKSELRLLQPIDVYYIEKNNQNAVYFCKAEQYASRQSLQEILKTLPGQFHQIHKSFIVNQMHIKQLLAESGGRYSVLMENGETLPMGRAFYKNLKSVLGT